MFDHALTSTLPSLMPSSLMPSCSLSIFPSLQENQRATEELKKKFDQLSKQMNALDGTMQDRLDSLESAHHRLESYVHDMTDKCVSLEAHHHVHDRLEEVERQVLEMARVASLSPPSPPPPPPSSPPRDERIDVLMQRLEEFEASWSATTLESVEKTSMRLLAMEQRLEGVSRGQREYIQRSGSERRTEDRQIDNNTRTIEMLEEEVRSVKKQLIETLSIFSKRREKAASGSPAIMSRSRML